MSVILQVVEQRRAIRREGRHPVRVELGERQVRALVDEVNAVLIAQMADPWLMERFGIEPSPGPPLHTVEEMATGRCTVFGLPVAVVESPDYLLVIGGDRT